MNGTELLKRAHAKLDQYHRDKIPIAAEVEAALEQYKRDLEELRQKRRWVRDLQSGMYVNCVYCGHRYGPREDTPVSMAEVLKQHIEQCPEHPLSKLRVVAVAAYHALKSYEFGNASTELAAECATSLALVLQIGSDKMPVPPKKGRKS